MTRLKLLVQTAICGWLAWETASAWAAGPNSEWAWLYRMIPAPRTGVAHVTVGDKLVTVTRAADGDPRFVLAVLACAFALAAALLVLNLWSIVVDGQRIGQDGILRNGRGEALGNIGPFTWRR